MKPIIRLSSLILLITLLPLQATSSAPLIELENTPEELIIQFFYSTEEPDGDAIIIPTIESNLSLEPLQPPTNFYPSNEFSQTIAYIAHEIGLLQDRDNS